MKAKIRVLFWVLACFMLTSCPGGHFHEYKYVGIGLDNTNVAFTKVAYDASSFLEVRAGRYLQFIKPKQSGLATIIKFSPNFSLKKHNIVEEVKSSAFGNLTRVDSLPYPAQAYATKNGLNYNLILGANHYTMEKEMPNQNDTITIKLTNGKVLHFVKEKP